MSKRIADVSFWGKKSKDGKKMAQVVIHEKIKGKKISTTRHMTLESLERLKDSLKNE